MVVVMQGPALRRYVKLRVSGDGDVVVGIHDSFVLVDPVCHPGDRAGLRLWSLSLGPSQSLAEADDRQPVA